MASDGATARWELVGQGLKDFDFGNNVQMMKGQTYTVWVTEASDHAVSTWRLD